ncbi:DUF6316 family protein [Methylomonas sp. MK1]|uniref:DUF6316 family protein n=1 Tax=Methylomonas sp. MK1 TaxID=1131552 RepID=UPI003FA36407
MFRTERFLSVVNPDTGLPAWYFLTREGRRGPFSSKTNAQLALYQYVADYARQGLACRRTRLLANS